MDQRHGLHSTGRRCGVEGGVDGAGGGVEGGEAGAVDAGHFGEEPAGAEAGPVGRDGQGGDRPDGGGGRRAGPDGDGGAGPGSNVVIGSRCTVDGGDAGPGGVPGRCEVAADVDDVGARRQGDGPDRPVGSRVPVGHGHVPGVVAGPDPGAVVARAVADPVEVAPEVEPARPVGGHGEDDAVDLGERRRPYAAGGSRATPKPVLGPAWVNYAADVDPVADLGDGVDGAVGDPRLDRLGGRFGRRSGRSPPRNRQHGQRPARAAANRRVEGRRSGITVSPGQARSSERGDRPATTGERTNSAVVTRPLTQTGQRRPKGAELSRPAS